MVLTVTLTVQLIRMLINASNWTFEWKKDQSDDFWCLEFWCHNFLVEFWLATQAALKNARLEKEAADARIRELEAAAREVGWEIYSWRLDLLTYRDFFLLALCSFTGWGAFGPNGEILRAAAEGGALWGRFGPWQNESTGHDLWSKWSVKLWSNPITLSVFASFSIHEHFHIFVICSPRIFVVRNKTVVLRNLEVKEFRRQSELQGNSVSQDRFDGKHFDVNMWHFWVLFPRKRTSQKLENWLKSSVFLARILRYAWMPRNMNHEWRWICYWKVAG